MYREGWTEDQRREFDRLERVERPSEWERGTLAALRMTAQGDADHRRAQALTDRWARAS